MAYVNSPRPTKCFGAVLVDWRSRDVFVCNEIRAHDAVHARKLAEARARRAFPARVYVVKGVWKGRLDPA